MKSLKRYILATVETTSEMLAVIFAAVMAAVFLMQQFNAATGGL